MRAELRLAELRKHRGASQVKIAKRLEVSQSNVSQLERGDDVKLSTLASYVKALGGHLEVSAVFDDETVQIG
jgi:transcriptional regulator with XRE-family HTH domain